ncbi:hypothetical protein Slala04_01980 [Streptomyces lavendulae subsp. lavendulae]|nr:hypothetical protein Slala04_01980 [Streptomyces lavendulae subsp. lavendulae]
MYLLSTPGHDGVRRTREAVASLRASGYPVHADYSLDPANTTQAAPAPDPRAWYRTTVAQATAARSTQDRHAVPARPVPAAATGRPANTPTATGPGRSR